MRRISAKKASKKINPKCLGNNKKTWSLPHICKKIKRTQVIFDFDAFSLPTAFYR
jgi:hypothetical protein